MKGETTAVRTLRWVLVSLGLALPVLSLVPLGSVWLWQQGLLVHWAVAACASTLAAWAAQRWLLGASTAPAAAALPPDTAVDATWTPIEQAAWERVRAIAVGIAPETLATREALLAIGIETVEAVATTLKPDRKDPLLQFTAPEALALVERVSGRLETFVREHVPLGDRLTLAQIAELYRWRGTIELAEQAWSVWRVLRMLNPASALANEVRERISKELVTWGKGHVARRLATFYVEEVGRAAIDLYGGRLRVPHDRLAATVTRDSARDLATVEAEDASAEPLRLLVAGQVSAGKSSLVNALAREIHAAVDALPATARFNPYRLNRDGLPAALVIDSPGLTTAEADRAAFLREAERADLVVWVVAAHRADREIDRAGIAGLRAHFAARPNRVAPPLLLVVTHVDKLRPFQEWTPPYNLNDAASAKAVSIRSALEAVAAELGVSTDDIVPCSLPQTTDPYNVDAVWGLIVARLPAARQARLLRTLRDVERAWDLGRVLSQVQGAGRVLAKSVRG